MEAASGRCAAALKTVCTLLSDLPKHGQRFNDTCAGVRSAVGLQRQNSCRKGWQLPRPPADQVISGLQPQLGA